MNKRKLLTYILIPILSVYLFLCNLSVISFATVPESQKVVSYSGTWESYGVNITGLGKYYVLQDTTGLSTSSYSLPKFYYTSDNVTFTDLSGVNLVINQLNKIVGVILAPSEIQTFQTNFFNKIGMLDNNNHAQGGLYDSSGNFYGYALNDITGCYYDHNSNDFNVTVPKYLPNNIYNVFKFYNYDTPPYIKIYGVTLQNVINNYGASLTSEQITLLTNIYNNYEFMFSLNWDTWNKKYSFSPFNNYYTVSRVGLSNPYYLVATNKTGYSQIGYTDWCNRYGLSSNDFDLSFGELTSSFGLSYRIYNKNVDIKVGTLTTYDFTNAPTVSSSEMTLYDGPEYGHPTVVNSIGNPGNKTSLIQIPLSKDPFYIYKDFNTLTNLLNKTYVPNQLTTNTYNNYNTSNDNSNYVNTEYIDNSYQYNSDIYDNSVSNFSEYIDNSFIDNSSVTNNVTNITNNYYNYDSGSSGGDGGNGGGNNNNNNGVLDTLLSAILNFFNAIGQVIATIFTGLLDMFSSVLSAIATITSDLTGITDFFGSLFGWMPEPIPQVIGVGFSLCVLAAVIKFIRG